MDPARIRMKTNRLRVICSKRNRGFAGACNVGIRRAISDRCRYFMLINNDTVLTDRSVWHSVKRMNRCPEIGALGVVNCRFDDPAMIWQTGFHVDYSTGRSKPATLAADSGAVMDIDYIPGSSMIVRSEVVEKAGYLDENYFAYFEDVDFCYRIKQSGYRVVVDGQARLLHKIGQSSSECVKEYLRTRNKLYFYSGLRESRFGRIYFSTVGRSLQRALFGKKHKTALLAAYAKAFFAFHAGRFGNYGLAS